MTKKESIKTNLITQIAFFLIITLGICNIPVFSFGEEVSSLEKMYNLQSHSNKTIINYEAELKENPDNALLHYESGVHFYAIGDKKKAIETLQKAKGLFLLQGNKNAAFEVEKLLGTLNVDEALEQINIRLDKLSTKVDKITEMLEKK